MNMKNEYDELVQSVIDKNLDVAFEENEFCNSQLGIYNVIENQNVKIIFSKINMSCDVVRKENDNPVFCRNNDGRVYRIHGEFSLIRDDLNKLASR